MKTVPAALDKQLFAAPGYRSFGLPDKSIAPTPLRTRTLWKVDTCEILLDLSRQQVLERIEDGRIAWAFCISANKSARRDIRVLTACVIELLGHKTGLPKKTANLTFDEVIELILPHHRPDLKGTELQRLLGVNPDTIRQITKRKGWVMSQRPKERYGPNASPKYSRGSVIEFFRKTRIS
ncbi:MAG TPA: hypothetical protein VFZ59_01690 [Verrucomicrobiae bacterium]|nr:hypothetical protein [Verrucomicrobiae bacterium]